MKMKWYLLIAEITAVISLGLVVISTIHLGDIGINLFDIILMYVYTIVYIYILFTVYQLDDVDNITNKPSRWFISSLCLPLVFVVWVTILQKRIKD